ncbi:response regulator [Niveibacterium sp. SC-1]|uniref:response regulator n=1 Tax=Niveibacterium sp. SC-1 TaxID=3135646 RepID=UPI00311DEDD9
MTQTAASPKKIFLIEDSVLLRDALSDMLTEIGEVSLVGTAQSEDEALQALEATEADLVIVDLALKSGTGLGVLTALREQPGRYHAPAAVVLSNHAYPQMRSRCSNLGALAFFDKSLQLPDLLAFVRDYATRSTGAAPASSPQFRSATH